ncbi:MAG: helix-turn-helix domain-containing protein [Gammaproteobacteria bacterium]|nr:helix-turn-helix domain-containing protein [Gammaproteobacteria bacterium]MBU1647447.1 helix-turn-helix domain-containing protein [Gammaproteobacteria bacterium]MBU1973239.1 helix-turn-helix domain-containing protein [Gammaproteobacteria bacterium]
MTTEAIQKASEILGSQANLARVCSVSPAMVHQWLRGIRPIAAERCPTIERATSGAVRCEDIRPDVDWAYLRATDCDIKPGAANAWPAPHPEREAA